MEFELPIATDEDVRTERIEEAVVLFAGDSGDGMQLAGTQLTLASAHAQNDLATLPDYPAEIRAPAGTTYGVSGFQLRFGASAVKTPGDEVDLLVAMNPAALKVNVDRVRAGGTLLVNINAFDEKNLQRAGYDANPLEGDTLEGFRLIEVELERLTREALKDTNLDLKAVGRCKNMFALGLALWLYARPVEPTLEWLEQKFSDRPPLHAANQRALKKGYHYGETTELLPTRYEVAPAQLDKGTYRTIRGAEALALGLVAASQKSGLKLFYGSYPITPASDILHALSKHKNFGVTTFQAEDEIAAVGAALGASFGGHLGVTATSGPGLALKTETLGLAMMTELPLVIIDVQRGGPSTGLPTKTEQSDLQQALYGRNGESPLPVLAATAPSDCFRAAYEACRIATKYMTPVILLADAYLSTASAPWRIPEAKDLPPFEVHFAKNKNHGTNGEAQFLPYLREEETLARPWARPGTPALEHRLGGLEKQDGTGDVSYDPENHQRMVRLRAEKVQRVAAEIAPLQVQGEREGELLVLGWGSTRGTIEEAVSRARAKGRNVSGLALRHLHPLSPELESVLNGFERILVAELNEGQFIEVLRAQYGHPFISYAKTEGRPFAPAEIEAKINEISAKENVAPHGVRRQAEKRPYTQHP